MSIDFECQSLEALFLGVWIENIVHWVLELLRITGSQFGMLFSFLAWVKCKVKAIIIAKLHIT